MEAIHGSVDPVPMSCEWTSPTRLWAVSFPNSRLISMGLNHGESLCIMPGRKTWWRTVRSADEKNELQLSLQRMKIFASEIYFKAGVKQKHFATDLLLLGDTRNFWWEYKATGFTGAPGPTIMAYCKNSGDFNPGSRTWIFQSGWEFFYKGRPLPTAAF